MNFLQTDFLISALLIASAFIVFGLLILRLNNTSLPPVYPTPMPIAIGGWLIVIAVLVCLSLISSFFALFELSIWMDGFWTVYFQNPESYLTLSLQVLFALNVVFILTFGFYSIILFFKRRDITPKVMTYYIVISTAVNCFIKLSTILAALSAIPFDGLPARLFMIQLLGIVIVILLTMLTINYLRNATRSKETFVLPHPSLVDHEYPEFELNKES
ncbi:DUF2569 family protein [Chitinophaga rhizosphaerae]|uniref:DUF2569 family protein n=1 Tax=Chitinophaga rhizosphaerae TaxID=1864947 RepID=UPI000F802F3D|nr:DUF2569 family protein [Chitinophaga rhizosphaerae]